MYVALPHWMPWQRRTTPRVLARTRVQHKRRRLTAAERRRYIWQAVWLVLLLLAACVVGLVLGVNYQD